MNRAPRLLGIWLLSAGFAAAAPVVAQQPPCQPCAGIRVEDPGAWLDELVEAPALDEDSHLYVAWRAPLDGTGELGLGRRLQDSRAVPWPLIRFEAPTPILAHVDRLDVELAAAARLARELGERAHVQIEWRPEGGRPGEGSAGDYAFLIKRAAVAISGANSAAKVIVGPLGPETDYLAALYAEEIAAYVDGIALADAGADELASAVDLLGQLDPGRPIVLDHLDYPEPAALALARAAGAAERGFAATFFAVEEGADLGPLKILAREFVGDLSLDPYSVPSGGIEAWSFVRGEDLSLQVLVELERDLDEVRLDFTESQLRDPRRVMADGTEIPLLGVRRSSRGVELTVADPDPVLFLKLNRLTAAEIEGIQGLDEEVTVASERDIPVSEILRRHQAFLDGQARRLQTYTAENTLSLRMQSGAGARAVEITFQGDYFYTEGEGFDWAWQRFFINGVDWRSKRIPQIPLLQPEKASAVPAEITLTKDYSYRLRGTEMVEGRDCWVVDFEPAVQVTPGRSLYRGTVWIDRGLYARVKSRTLQLGLTGDVVSNDETIFFRPVDASGEAAAWSVESYFLPLRTTGQQIFSILNAALVVERELTLADVRINPEDFASRRAEVQASDATMLRDTEEGMRYLVKDKESGERVVQMESDPTRLFLVGGVFHDEALDFPLPLGGVNWLSFDFKGTGGQANVFFAGLLVLADVATPSLFGTRWEAGADVFVLGLPGTDSLFIDGVETSAQDVETLRPNLDLTLGRNIGNYFKVQLAYELGWHRFDRADDTDPAFVIPSDHVDHELALRLRYNRDGFRVRLGGAYNLRSDWDPWGFAQNPDFDADKEAFVTWGGGVGKTWYLANFKQAGLAVEYVGGRELDRFSKYQFGPFSDIVVRGYRSELVRAEEAWAAHASYGFNFGELFQLDFLADTAWASDDATGLDRELLAGVGVSGTFVGPWRTIVNLEVGKAVAGPDDGWTALIAFLKLFK